MADSKLNIIVIGSGIAGLAAAAILREHHNVTVYERGGPDVATGGQGICVFPNGLRILCAMGFDSDRSEGVPCLGYRFFDKDFNLAHDIPIDFKGRYGADMLMLKRTDLRGELLRLATAPATDQGPKGEPATIIFHSGAIDLDPENAVVTLEGGTVVKGDVVVAADGIHSKVRHRITGDKNLQPKKMGFTLFRVAASAADVENAVGHLPDWWTSEGGENRLCLMEAVDDESHRMVVHYPIQNHNYRSFSCFLPMKEDRGSTVESWYAEADRKEMLPIFGDYNETLRKILSEANEVKVWDLQDMDPLPNWNRGRAILIGDAAHAMTPLQGQGANMAMEDADSLRLLAPGMGQGEIEAVLRKIDGVRRPRAARVLQDTRDQAEDIPMEERISRMDYNCNYKGIYEALKELE